MSVRTPFFLIVLGLMGCSGERTPLGEPPATGRGDAASESRDSARPDANGMQANDAALDAASRALADAGATATETRDAALPHDAGSARDGGSSDFGFCPGYPPESFASYSYCRSDAECPQPGSFSFLCLLAQPPVCGGAAPPPDECASDPDCGAGRICTTRCSRKYCEDGCRGQSCGDNASCVSGRCVPFPCDRGGLSCPDNALCRPGDTRADASGCVVRTCTSTADCPCGTCFKGACALHPGLCLRDIQAP